MSFFSVKALQAAVCNVISDLVGDNLSKDPRGTPSVFLARARSPKLGYPHIMVDHLGTSNIGLKERTSFIDADDNLLSHHDKLVTLNVTVFGGIKNDAAGIAEHLKDLMSIGTGLSLFNQITNCDVSSIGNIATGSSSLNTEYEEFASFNIEVAVAYEISSTPSGFIETIRVTSEYEGDTDTIEAASPAE